MQWKDVTRSHKKYYPGDHDVQNDFVCPSTKAIWPINTTTFSTEHFTLSLKNISKFQVIRRVFEEMRANTWHMEKHIRIISVYHCSWTIYSLKSILLIKRSYKNYITTFCRKHHTQGGQHFNFSKFPDFSLTFPENFPWLWSSLATQIYQPAFTLVCYYVNINSKFG